MNRRRRDLDDEDLDSLFSAGDAHARRLERADLIERGKQRLEAEAAADAVTADLVRANMIEATRKFIWREYQRAGVEPPLVNANGDPSVSLSMLLRLGWRIEDMGRDDGNVLIAPPRR